ncbi:MAG: PEP-CTERM system TPR-repeat protein PrsT [Burkholderiales bacterium]|nr:PEP-CTERM system TPR-repeat protein PrsT [Burkholderiales bacterium]
MTKSNARTAVAAGLLAALLVSSGCGKQDPGKLVESAKAYVARGDTAAAIIELKTALQAKPDLPEARFLLGRALLDVGDAEAAELELRKALDMRHSANDVLPVLARALLALGRYDKVIEEGRRDTLLSPEGRADVQNSVAVAYVFKGDLPAANKANQAALTASGDYAPARLTQARLRAVAGDFNAAISHVDELLRKSPQYTEAWKLKGDVLAAREQLPGAIEAYRKAVELRPGYMLAHSALMTALMKSGRKEDAAAQLEAMRKAAPGSPHTLYFVAQLAAARSDFKAAREASQQLLRVVRDNVPALEQAGSIEYGMRSFVQAETHAAKAVQLAPDRMSARRLLVLTHLAQGDPRKAVAALSPVLGKIDGDAAMLALAGEAYMGIGDLKRGEEFYSRSIKLDPKDPAKRTALALARFARGDADSAFSELEQVSASTTDITADLAIVASHLRRGTHDRALKAIDVLEKKRPNAAFVHNLRGRVLLAKGDVAAARRSLERALAASAAFVPAAATLAELDMNDRKPEQAAKRFEGVLAAEPRNATALVGLAEVKWKSGGKSEEVLEFMSKAIAAAPGEASIRIALVSYLLAINEPRKAISAAQEGLATLADSVELHDALGRAQQAAAEYNQALATYAKLAALQPRSAQPHLRSAEIHVAAKNLDAATASLRKALALQPDLTEAQRGLVLLDLGSSRPQDAIAVAREVQKQRPREAVGFLLEGDIHATQKRWPEAIASYRAALKAAPASETAVKLMSMLYAAERADEAEKFAEAWVKDHTQDLSFRAYRAEAALVRRDYAAAERLYKGLTELMPGNPLFWNNLAWVSAKQKRPAALEYAEKANQLAPNQPSFMDTLADLLADRGDTARANDLLAKAVELAPQNPDIRLNYARVLIQAGKKPAAKAQLDELAKLGNKYPGQAAVAELMKQI